MKLRTIKKLRNGFTLMELLVVIGMVGILTALALFNFPIASKQLALDRSAYKLAQDIRIIQGLAMSAKEIPGYPAFKGSYGIKLIKNQTEYTLFADLDGNNEYSGVTEKIPGITPNPIPLERGVSIVDITPAQSIAILFSPPDPTVTVTPPSLPAAITISAGDQSKTISVNAVGLITVGKIVSGKVIGSSCSAGFECASGFCADGYCCNSACTGTCQSCGLAGLQGSCTARSPGDNTECSACNECAGGTNCQAMQVADGNSCPSCCVAGTSCGYCASGYCKANSTCGIDLATVTNNGGATNIRKTTARLNGEITSAGGNNPTVYIYWGLTDGGTNPASWSNSVNLGTRGVGTFFTDISGLTQATTYRYRTRAVNSAGISWAASTYTFNTAPAQETIRPTGFSDPNGRTTNEPSAYDGNINTASQTLYGNNYNPSTLFGTPWQTPQYLPWSSATIYVTLQRQGTSGGDQAAVEVRDSAGTLKHTLLSLGGSAVAKQEVSQVLNADDWGGVGFPNIANLRVYLRDTKSSGPDNMLVYIYEIRIVGNVSD